MPSSQEIQSAIAGEGYTFGFYPETNEYSWPWLIGEDADGKYVYSSNKLINNSYAIMYSTFSVSEGQVVAFDYKLSTEADLDMFYVQVDGVLTMQSSGNVPEWQTCYAFVCDPLISGTQTHELSFTYLNDEGAASGDDVVMVRNLRIVNEAEIAQNNQSIIRSLSIYKFIPSL